MSSTEVHQLVWGNPITVHAFNKDRTQVAVCPNNNEVHIYSKSGNTWNLSHVLTEHDKLVTGIDWAPNTNRIVTCSQDRNAYVWTWDGTNQIWKPALVLLRINRAATCVRWSPQENKFAVGSGARLIAVCHFEEDSDWWVSKHIKKPIRSTVLCLAWHPDNILLAAGSSDMKARVFSAFIKGVDPKTSSAIWGDKLPFGTICAEYEADVGGWVQSVAFAPSGNFFAFASHGSGLSIASPSIPNSPINLYTQGLPLNSILFVNEDTIIGAGHDCVPYMFGKKGDKWEVLDKIDQGAAKKAASGNIAMNKFRQMDSRAQASAGDTELTSTHQNSISTIREHAGSKDRVTAFSSSGVDGKLVIWTLLDQGMASMRLR